MRHCDHCTQTVFLRFTFPPLPQPQKKKSTCELPRKKTQACLTGGTLRLERELDEKDRQLQLQRAETHMLRERLRAIEAGDGGCGHRPRDSTTGGLGGRVEGSAPPTSSLLGASWGNNDNPGRSGTAPYPDPAGSQPVSPDGWGRANSTRTWSANSLNRGGGRRPSAGSTAPPGAHSSILRQGCADGGGGALNPEELVISATRVQVDKENSS